MYLQKHYWPILFACASAACVSVSPLPGGLVPTTMPTDRPDRREYTVSDTLVKGEACAETLLFIIPIESDAGLSLAKRRALQEAKADFLVDVTVDIYSLNVLYIYRRTCTVVQGRGAYYPRVAQQASSSPPASAASDSTAQHLPARPPDTFEVNAQLNLLRDRIIGCRDNFAPKTYDAKITLTIESSGQTKITDVQHGDDSGDRRFADCVKMVLQPLQFPPYQGEPTVIKTVVDL